MKCNGGRFCKKFLIKIIHGSDRTVTRLAVCEEFSNENDDHLCKKRLEETESVEGSTNMIFTEVELFDDASNL